MIVDEEDRRLDFGAFVRCTERVAASLATGGIGPGSRVSWQLPTSIDAIVLDVGGEPRDRISKMMPEVDRKLQDDGWERIVLVRERNEQVRVLIYNDEESISGLVVMVLDAAEMVFVNVAGLIDLEAMQKLASEMNIPGLEHLEDLDEYEEYQRRRDDDDEDD